MLIFLLSLILNPFGFIIKWLPALCLIAWPLIIHHLGWSDTLMFPTILRILFILICPTTRDLIHKLIGFKLISLPVAILIGALLITDKGSTLLSIVTPGYSTLQVAIGPVSLLIESLIVVNVIKTFNKWIGRLSNVHDEEAHDLSSWEPPLSRGSIAMRGIVILITIASYIGTYLLVQEAKTLLGERDVPVQFNHAIALLVSLQLIAFVASIYKDDGILSESAMIMLVATVPIFIAAWSFNRLKIESSSGWAAYFPFSLLSSWTNADDGDRALLFDPSSLAATSGRGQAIVFGELEDSLVGQGEPLARGADQPAPSSSSAQQRQLDFGALEQSVNLFAPADSFVKGAVLTIARQLIMVINSILGLSLHSIWTLWLIRWRSTIVQRLMQSILVQLHYICSLARASAADDEDEHFLY